MRTNGITCDDFLSQRKEKKKMNLKAKRNKNRIANCN